MTYSDNPQKFGEILAQTREINTKVLEPQTALPPYTHTPVEAAIEDESLPLYTQERTDILESLDQLAKAICGANSGNLPLATYPALDENATEEENEDAIRRQRVVSMYFDAIASGNCELLAAILSCNLVTTNTTDKTERTPLIAAIQAGKMSTVQFLTSSGAKLNVYGITATSQTNTGKAKSYQTYRTPLQYAAELGSLSIVKHLMESGADDSLMAPDGQLALRLAASHRHCEIVAYLPARRGGGFRRWKAKHATAMRRCRKAVRGMFHFGKFFVWDVPKVFVWTVPKHVLVLPVVKGVKWMREHWREVPGYVADALAEVMKAFRRMPAAIWRVVKGVPSFVADVVKEMGRCIKSCAKGLLKFIKGIPHAVEISLLWVWSGIIKVGAAIGNIFARLLSFMHTFIAATLDLFRGITLHDIWRGFVSVLRAIFIEAPKTIWGWICSFGETSLKVLKALFGCLGECVWCILKGIFDLVMFLPKNIGQILAACASSASSGWKEALVWVDPKRV